MHRFLKVLVKTAPEERNPCDSISIAIEIISYFLPITVFSELYLYEQKEEEDLIHSLKYKKYHS